MEYQEILYGCYHVEEDTKVLRLLLCGGKVRVVREESGVVATVESPCCCCCCWRS